MINSTDQYCIIMAGGIGSRFWPLSRSSKPKQFIDILGTGKSLLQQTFERMEKVCPSENIYIVTSGAYKDLVLQQLPKVTSEQVLLEPMRRNTAPCIAYASYKIQKKNPNAVVIVAPSDHLILNEQKFIESIAVASEFAFTGNKLVTLGIHPNRPETGYGYIQTGEQVKKFDNLFKVKTFTEKPNLEMAKVFMESGEFYWNSGLFVWSLPAILDAFSKHLPEVNSLFLEISNELDTLDEAKVIEKTYAECRNISIDYGIMEKAENVYVICSDFGWSDLGTWGSLYMHLPKDDKANTGGANILLYNTENSLINIADDKLAVIQGLDNYIVVDTENVLLICRKEDEQQIKNFVNDVTLIKKSDRFI